MPRKGGGFADTLSAVQKTLKDQAQVEAFKQLEDPANQTKAVDLIVAAPIGTPEKMKILGALDSISSQAKARLNNPPAAAGAPVQSIPAAAGAPVQSIPAAAGSTVQTGGKTRRRRHRRRATRHKKFSS